MSNAMGNDGSEVIQRGVHIHRRRTALPAEEAAKIYDIAETAAAIAAAGVQHVGLQFPDDLLPHASLVTRLLRKELTAMGHPVTLFVMADTLFAPCCVDEVTSQHVDAQMIVKYGPSCRTATSRLPVHFVAPKPTLDLPDIAEKVHAFRCVVGTSEVVLAGDMGCLAALPDVKRLAEGLASPDDTLPALRIPDDAEPCDDAVFVVTGRDLFPTGTNPCNAGVFYIGDPDSGAALQALQWAEYASALSGRASDELLASTSPLTTQRTFLTRRLRQRLFLLEKIKDAEVVAIVVGSLAVKQYTASVEHLKQILHASGKQAVVVYVGKPNVPKLANYEEVDINCIIACPQSALFDYKEFAKPVVTPIEIAVALGRTIDESKEDIVCTLRPEYYSQELLPPIRLYKPDADAASRVDMSLTTGALRLPSTNVINAADADDGEEEEEGEDLGGALMLYKTKELAVWHESSVVSRLQQRNFRGLEPKYGESEVQESIVQGLSGIASGYEGEPSE